MWRASVAELWREAAPEEGTGAQQRALLWPGEPAAARLAAGDTAGAWHAATGAAEAEGVVTAAPHEAGVPYTIP